MFLLINCKGPKTVSLFSKKPFCRRSDGLFTRQSQLKSVHSLSLLVFPEPTLLTTAGKKPIASSAIYYFHATQAF